MQTRKRAKSVMFGKKPKEKKEDTAKEVEEKELSATPVETPEKEVKEVKKEAEKAESSELSATPPKTEEEPEAEAEDEKEKEKETSEVATPSSEFISDGALSSTPEQPKASTETPAATSEETSSELSATPKNEETPQPAEVTPPPTSTPGQPVQTPDASASAQSAFTIQTGNTEPTPPPVVEGEKKRFGVYFIVVALIAFVLGLGAMAALSYFGVVNMHLSGFSSKIQLPAILGAKPTPSPLPQPTGAPTAKPVDLTAFTITVLNGSGISGKAADVKTSLTTAGYKVVSTGNADKSTYTKTQIAAKKTVDPTFLSKLQDELNKTYVVDPTIAPLSSGTSDVTVTIGSQTAK